VSGCLRKRSRGLAGLLSFAGLHFHGLGCGKFSIPVWLGARGTRVQFTRLPSCCSTSRTRHGNYLPQREFLGFHNPIMQHSTAKKCSVLLMFNTLANATGRIWFASDFSTILRKNEHFW